MAKKKDPIEIFITSMGFVAGLLAAALVAFIQFFSRK
jgi:energy-converting hydrogenase Eha subunit A